MTTPPTDEELLNFFNKSDEDSFAYALADAKRPNMADKHNEDEYVPRLTPIMSAIVSNGLKAQTACRNS